MTLLVIKAGVQTTLQGAPFRGQRHIGLPSAGAADCLSLAHANKLVGNIPKLAGLEIALSGASFVCETQTSIACTGAHAKIQINGEQHSQHESVPVSQGDQITIGPAQQGCRSYLAISGGFDIEPILGSQSTYQPIGLGGYRGRALHDGDKIPTNKADVQQPSIVKTPDEYIPTIINSAILRVTDGAEYDHLNSESQYDLCKTNWLVDQRMSRMGLMLGEKKLSSNNSQSMPSAAVFSGTIQCPPDGSPFLLGPDAQTTGGYPRIAQVIRADRHLIGQLRPGSKVQLVQTTIDRATAIYREKLALLKPWLGDIQLW